MLTMPLRRVLDRTNGTGTFVAHVIRLPVGLGGPFMYHLGLTLGSGTPLGLVTGARGDVLRQWKRLTAVEDYLTGIEDRLVGMFVYPSTCAEPEVIGMLIRLYGIDTPDPLPSLDSDRTRILTALRPTSSDNGKASDSTGPG